MAGLLSRLLGRPDSEQRAGGGMTFAGGYAITSGGTAVTPAYSENLSTVTACISAIASGLGALPARVYRLEGDGRVEAPNHFVSRLIQAPNPYQTWPDLIEFLLSQVLLNGNALATIELDGAGRPIALQPVPWSSVSVQLLGNGRLAYDVVGYGAISGGPGVQRRFLQDQVFHLKDRSDDGFVGRSRISRAPDVLRAAAGVQTFSSAVWENSASFSGAFTLPAGITPAGVKRMDAFVNERYVGAANAKRILLVDAGTTFTPISVSPEDAETLDSRRFSVIELCRLFNVPPPIVQDYSHATFTNASQASDWFATNTLSPWARKIEAEFARSVFADPSGAFHIEIDLSGLVRGDYATRWTANVAAVTAGILTADEIRAQEGYGPLPKAEPVAAPPARPVADAPAKDQPPGDTP